MKLPIDLKKQHDDRPTMNDDMPEGPLVHLRWNEPYDLPDSGSMEVKFRVHRREECIAPDGRKKYEVCLELTSIEEVEADESVIPASRHNEAGEALDKLRAEYED